MLRRDYHPPAPEPFGLYASSMNPTRSPSPPPSGPLPIRRLQEALINRIAAGEVHEWTDSKGFKLIDMVDHT